MEQQHLREQDTWSTADSTARSISSLASSFSTKEYLDGIARPIFVRMPAMADRFFEFREDDWARSWTPWGVEKTQLFQDFQWPTCFMTRPTLAILRQEQGAPVQATLL
jgi:hypothetical protein